MKITISGPAPTSYSTPSAIVAARLGLSVDAVQLSLASTPLTAADHLVHGLAALEDFRAGGPRALAQLTYAHNRIHAADAILRNFVPSRRGNMGQRAFLARKEWLRLAMLDLMSCEASAALALRQMHARANDA